MNCPDPIVLFLTEDERDALKTVMLTLAADESNPVGTDWTCERVVKWVITEMAEEFERPPTPGEMG